MPYNPNRRFQADGSPPIPGWSTLLSTVAGAGSYVAELGAIHLRNSDAVSGVASTAANAAPGGRLSGSVGDDGWTTLPNGSSVMAIGIGHPETGPMIVLSRNVPDAYEAPEGVYNTEILRLVLKGSVSVGGQRYLAAEWRLSEANVRQDTVTHGSDGSTQLLVYADRRYAIPVHGDVPSGLAALQAALRRQLEPLHMCTAPSEPGP